MITKKRLIIFVAAALLLAVASLFVEIDRYQGERICGSCDTRQEFHETSYFVLNCMDGGTCQMHADDPGDAALLALIYDQPDRSAVE